jgi:hypothetical protein
MHLLYHVCMHVDEWMIDNWICVCGEWHLACTIACIYNSFSKYFVFIKFWLKKRVYIYSWSAWITLLKNTVKIIEQCILWESQAKKI